MYEMMTQKVFFFIKKKENLIVIAWISIKSLTASYNGTINLTQKV